MRFAATALECGFLATPALAERTDVVVLDNGDKRQAIWVPLTTDLYIFRWDHPKTNVAANLAVLPALNEGGRVRSQASLKLKHELINDLFLEISFNDSYDNRPAETARTNDWNVVTSLGYSF
jgi:hypothetical protein